MVEVNSDSGIEKKESKGALQRFRESRTAQGVVLGSVVLGSAALLGRGYTNAVVESQMDVARLSDRTEAAVFESYDSSEPRSVEPHKYNVLFTGGTKFYSAPLEIEDRRFFGRVNTDNHVATLGSNSVMLADSASFMLHGVGSDVWVGVRPVDGEVLADGGVVYLADYDLAKEVSSEPEAEDGTTAQDEQQANDSEETNVTTSDDGQTIEFKLSDVIWAKAEVNEETGMPTIYYADTEQAAADVSVESVSVSADTVTVTGRNIGRIVIAEDVSESFGSGGDVHVHEILDFVSRFIGSTDDDIVKDMSQLGRG